MSAGYEGYEAMTDAERVTYLWSEVDRLDATVDDLRRQLDAAPDLCGHVTPEGDRTWTCARRKGHDGGHGGWLDKPRPAGPSPAQQAVINAAVAYAETWATGAVGDQERQALLVSVGRLWNADHPGAADLGRIVYHPGVAALAGETDEPGEGQP